MRAAREADLIFASVSVGSVACKAAACSGAAAEAARVLNHIVSRHTSNKRTVQHPWIYAYAVLRGKAGPFLRFCQHSAADMCSS